MRCETEANRKVGDLLRQPEITEYGIEFLHGHAYQTKYCRRNLCSAIKNGNVPIPRKTIPLLALHYSIISFKSDSFNGINYAQW
jgi:hypothetical protein